MNPFGHMVSEISSTVIICFFVSEVVLNVGAAEEKEGISIRLPPWTMRAAALLFLPFLNAESSFDKHEPLPLMKSIPLARTKRANKLLLHHR
jgi:predicted membrane chloride channel (bestrophin family)